MISQDLPSESKKIQSWLKNRNFDYTVIMLEKSAASAENAANVLKCDIKQIAKSLIFRTEKSQRPVLAIVGGANKVDLERLGLMVGEKVVKADAEYVKEVSGFSIGGIPPIGHRNKMNVFIDDELNTQKFVWAAAGNPKAVFRLEPKDLETMTQGKVAKICL
jgi:Cys-tRNA(Pro) deacylase